MTVHKEGYKIIFIFFSLLFGIAAVINVFAPVQSFVHYIIYIVFTVFWFLIIRFFRVPSRKYIFNENTVLCPADGKIVAIEEIENSEYFGDRRKQVSVFMSINNVHFNIYPVSGIIRFFKYYPGKFLVAYNPKSSLENERTSLVIETNDHGMILLRQIAGAVARRIVSYVSVGNEAQQCKQFGFIKFGSRVDVILPLDAEIKVEINQKVKAGLTVIAVF